MKSLLLLMMIAAFSWSNTLVANSHMEDLKGDLKKLATATEEFDFENDAFQDDHIIINQDLAKSWAAEQFGSIEAFTELLVRIKTNLDLLAKDKEKPNSSAEDYKDLILSLVGTSPLQSSEDAAPFKCYNAYEKEFWMCTAYGVVGEYGGSGSDCGIYLAYIARGKRNFYNCLEDNYGN